MVDETHERLARLLALDMVGRLVKHRDDPDHAYSIARISDGSNGLCVGMVLLSDCRINLQDPRMPIDPAKLHGCWCSPQELFTPFCKLEKP